MKEISNKNRSKLIVCISLIIIIITGMVVSNTLSVNGDYLVQETKIQKDGYTLVGTLYVPKVALAKDGDVTLTSNGNNTNKVPAVITHGGGSANRYVQQAHIVEIIKRGIVVFAIDCYTHGESDDYAEGWNAYAHVHDAIEYVHSLNFVDKSQVGYWGHSQGGNAAMLAMMGYSGYYTLEDKLLNMLHDELNVDITAEMVAAQNPDAVAEKLDDYGKGYYDLRKSEVIEEYNDLRISFGITEGMATGEGPYVNLLELAPNIEPSVVEVGGIPVIRDIQANTMCTLAMGDEALAQRSLEEMGISGSYELPQAAATRALFGTGDETVELSTLYSVNRSDTTEQALSTNLGAFDENSWSDASVQQAADQKTLRSLIMYPGWHNSNHYSQDDIASIANFISIATGYNNGYVAETGGVGAVSFDDTQTWKLTHGANTIAFFALLVLAVALAASLLGEKQFAAAHCLKSPAQQSKKSVGSWMFIVLIAVVPILLITPFMSNNFINASIITKFDRINPIVSWSLLCAILLFGIIIVKWFAYDKKRVQVSFREFYGLAGNAKSIFVSLGGVLIAWFIIVIVIYLYNQIFNGANFMAAFPALNFPSQFTVLSTERYVDWFLYFLYFLPFWIVSGMFMTSGRMRDLSGWRYTLIQVVLNFIPFAAFVYITYFGYMNTGGAETVLGLNWATTIQMLGLGFALPISVIFQRVLYKRTNSCLPGAMLNSMIFTLPFICTVVGYTVSSMPIN